LAILLGNICLRIYSFSPRVFSELNRWWTELGIRYHSTCASLTLIILFSKGKNSGKKIIGKETNESNEIHENKSFVEMESQNKLRNYFTNMC
jgi:hypothetical protein